MEFYLAVKGRFCHSRLFHRFNGSHFARFPVLDDGGELVQGWISGCPMRPSCFAMAIHSACLKRIYSRSNCARLANTESMKRPAGVLVSICSFCDTNLTFFLFSEAEYRALQAAVRKITLPCRGFCGGFKTAIYIISVVNVNFRNRIAKIFRNAPFLRQFALQTADNLL